MHGFQGNCGLFRGLPTTALIICPEDDIPVTAAPAVMPRCQAHKKNTGLTLPGIFCPPAGVISLMNRDFSASLRQQYLHAEHTVLLGIVYEAVILFRRFPNYFVTQSVPARVSFCRSQLGIVFQNGFRNCIFTHYDPGLFRLRKCALFFCFLRLFSARLQRHCRSRCREYTRDRHRRYRNNLPHIRRLLF